jgi:phosphoglycolate phosphatase-like HAD superfamily hydrolase
MLFLWDIDGTLLSCGGAGLRALERACRDLHDLDRAGHGVTLAGNTDHQICHDLFQLHLGRTPEETEIQTLLDRYLVHLEEEVAASAAYRVMPFVEATLSALEQAGHLHGLCTGNIAEGARIKLERGNLWRHFPFGGFGSDAVARADIVARAIERGCAAAGRRLSPREVLVVGDTPRDVAAAHANGVRCIAVATGSYDTDALRATGAELVIETLEEVPALRL